MGNKSTLTIDCDHVDDHSQLFNDFDLTKLPAGNLKQRIRANDNLRSHRNNVQVPKFKLKLSQKSDCPKRRRRESDDWV